MRHTGIPVDPIYTLAAWEVVMTMVGMEKDEQGGTFTLGVSPLTVNDRLVVLHTGGTLDLFGLAQRFPRDFQA